MASSGPEAFTPRPDESAMRGALLDLAWRTMAAAPDLTEPTEKLNEPTLPEFRVIHREVSREPSRSGIVTVDANPAYPASPGGRVTEATVVEGVTGLETQWVEVEEAQAAYDTLLNEIVSGGDESGRALTTMQRRVMVGGIASLLYLVVDQRVNRSRGALDIGKVTFQLFQKLPGDQGDEFQRSSEVLLTHPALRSRDSYWGSDRYSSHGAEARAKATTTFPDDARFPTAQSLDLGMCMMLLDQTE